MEVNKIFGCVFPTDYHVDFWDGKGPTRGDLKSAMKYAFLIYDNIYIDRNTETTKKFSDWLLVDEEDDGVVNSLSAYICSFQKLKTSQLDLPPNIDLLSDAAFQAIVQKDGRFKVWENVGKAKGREIAELLIVYSHLCFTKNLEFYCSKSFHSLLTQILNIYKKDVMGLSFDKNILKLILPHSDELSWRDVLTLRESVFHESFQDFIFKPESGLSMEETEINKFILDKLFHILRHRRPQKWGHALSRAVANIPIPLIGVNPYSIYKGIKEGVNESNEFKLYGWLYFLAEAHGLSNNVEL